MRNGRSLRFAQFALLVLSACSQGADGEWTGETSSAIVNGTADTTHEAVVYLDNGCTGTIVQVTGNTGYVLTAGHCCTVENTPPDNVILGGDFSTATSSNTYPVIASSVKWDPNFDDSTGQHDFCMMQFSGASSATPVIPVMTPAEDNLAPGTVVNFVGYGNTSENDSSNTVRREISGPITSVDSLLIYYNTGSTGAYPINGGPCDGDSGGPALTTSGPLLVAGVTSDGPDNCAGTGAYSGRVSEVYTQFIAPYLGIPAGSTPDAGNAPDAATPSNPVASPDAGSGTGTAASSDASSEAPSSGGAASPDAGTTSNSGGSSGSEAPPDAGSSNGSGGENSPSIAPPKGGGCDVAPPGAPFSSSSWLAGFVACAMLFRLRRVRRS